VAAFATAIMILPVALDTGAGFAATRGVGVAHPAKPAREVVYLAVRLGPAQLLDSGVVNEVERLNASAVVDQRTAEANPEAVLALNARSIDIENGGTGRRIDLPWRRAQADVVKSRRYFHELTGQPVQVFVPARHIDGIDLMWCRGSHSRPVVPNHELVPGDDEPVALTARHTYVVAATEAPPAQVLVLLHTIADQMAAKHLDGAPLAELR